MELYIAITNATIAERKRCTQDKIFTFRGYNYVLDNAMVHFILTRFNKRYIIIIKLIYISMIKDRNNINFI